MAQRRFGPTLGAGVVVIEQEGQKAISPGALGVTCYFGPLEKGEMYKLISADTPSMYKKKCGGIVDYSLVPDAASGFFQEGNVAGELFLVRVTDGTEKTAEITLKNRKSVKSDVVKITAKSPGSWAGRQLFKYGVTTSGDLSETVLNIGAAQLSTTWADIEEDQIVGGQLILLDVTTKTYTIVAYDATTGDITVGSDQDMLADIGSPVPNPVNFAVALFNGDRFLGVKVGVNQNEPIDKWTLDIYESGNWVYGWDALSSDPENEDYFVPKINDDGNNYWIVVEDLWTGAINGDIMPANYHGISTSLTTTVLGIDIVQTTVSSPGGANGTIAVTYSSDVKPDILTLTCTGDSPTATFDVESELLGPYQVMPTLTAGTPWTAINDYSVGISVTDGATGWTTGDVITIEVNPLTVDALKGGYVVPDYIKETSATSAPLEVFVIDSNDVDSVTVLTGYDLTAGGTRAAGDQFLLVWPDQMSNGYDGIADLDAADYLMKMGIGSVIENLLDKNKGLVKIACPGMYETAVQKAGAALAERLNYQYRYEIPSNITDENAAIDYINNTIGRNDFAVVAFPSYGYITNPTGPGKKLISLTGDIQGEEAAYARNYDGYHKAATDVGAGLSRVIELPTGDRILNEEKLNPVGIQVIKKKSGNFIIWGDHTLYISGGITWKHKREQLSYYEHILQEGFDWIIFSINDPTTEGLARMALRSFFRNEYNKRAIRGNSLEDAAIIKIDSEINTDADRDAGNMYAEISLRLADTVERFIMTVSQQGIFETIT